MFQSKDYIYEIYRCGSFSAAAKNLYITQPAISIAVKKEEQELGQPIFERSSSHLLLTDAGRAYIDAVEKLHRIEDDLKIYWQRPFQPQNRCSEDRCLQFFSLQHRSPGRCRIQPPLSRNLSGRSGSAISRITKASRE